MFGVKHFFVCGLGFNLVKSAVGCIRRGMVLFDDDDVIILFGCGWGLFCWFGRCSASTH